MLIVSGCWRAGDVEGMIAAIQAGADINAQQGDESLRLTGLGSASQVLIHAWLMLHASFQTCLMVTMRVYACTG